MQVQKLVNEAEELGTIKEGLVEAGRKELEFSISRGAERQRRRPTGERSCSQSTKQWQQ